jgi:hypothetical protein
MLPTSKLRFRAVASPASDLAVAITSAEGSMPIVLPGATRCAKPAVMEPGPQPTSSSRIPGFRNGRRNAAAFSTVRLA